jgi:flagellar protein FlgJ
MSELTGMDADTMRINSQTGSRIAQLQRAKAAARGMDADKTDAVSREFEAQFISQMLENMFATSPVNDELGGGEGEEMFRSLMVDEYGKLIARSGGIGVADHVKRELIKLQEVE